MIYTVIILCSVYVCFVLLFVYISVVLDNIRNIKDDIVEMKRISDDILEDLERIKLILKLKK